MNEAQSLLESKIEQYKETVSAREETRRGIRSSLENLEGLPIRTSTIEETGSVSLPLQVEDDRCFDCDFELRAGDRVSNTLFKVTITGRNAVKIEAGSIFNAGHTEGSMRRHVLQKHGFEKGFSSSRRHGTPNLSWSGAKGKLPPDDAVDFFTDMLVALAGEENAKAFLALLRTKNA